MTQDTIGTIKFNGTIYDVAYTGVVRKIKAKSFTDFNGYDVEKQRQVIKQMGIYENGKLMGTCNMLGELFIGTRKVGQAKLILNQ